MSQPSNQNSPSNSSPNQTSSQKITVPNPQPSDIITNAVPLTMVHPSFASSLNLPKNKITTTNPSPSPKPKSKKKSKTNTTKKPKPQKPKSRYSSKFNMQELYLDNQGSASTNVASDAATTAPNVAIETAKEISSKSLNFEKGEIAIETEEKKNVVPNTHSHDEVDKDQLNLKAAEDSLKSLAHSVSSDKVVPDASTSLAQDQPQDDMIDDVDANKDDVVVDSNVQQEKDIFDDDTEQADKDDTVEDDLVVLKSVGTSKSGKTGVDSRLRERKGKETEVAAEATKSTKNKKVAAEATISAKKKMFGPVRRSSRVEIPVTQNKQASKRKAINLSDSEYDAEEDAPSITISPQKKTPKKRKTTVAASGADVEEDAPSIC
ncbi:hypothetical protein QL285_009901 [Trifolium repens]|nr:hypothetical protein QL285_009901 [Trifolium repens]